MIDFGQANIIKAPGCPHYVTRRHFARRIVVLGRGRIGEVTCESCVTRPVMVYGQCGKPGPVGNRPRTTKDPAGKGYLKRRADER